MRLIDADKLKIRETWALVENVSNTPNGISFAPLSCVLKKDIDDAPTVERPTYTDVIKANKEGFNNARRLYEIPKGDLISRETLRERIGDCEYFNSSFQKMTVAEFLTIIYDIINKEAEDGES